MPYNKGDFTQQGVAGDVSALVRLNEKRVMKVVLSSDDESDNCDISGAVYDLLNEEVYPIGAGVSGNIEITENGENINVAQYATATVNVAGGGDAPPLCTITVVNDTMPEQNRTVNNYISATDMTVQATVQLEPTETVQIIGFYQDMGDNSYTVVIPQASTPLFAYLINSDSTKFSNLDNITLFEMDGTYGPIVTDPTKLSSMTISVEIIDK